jgi:hypothetical protein
VSAQTKRAGVVAGIAAVGAVGLATMASTAFAPTARADDLSDIVASIQGDLTVAQSEFAGASIDFSDGENGAGLTSLFDGVDDYTLSPPDNLLVGSLDALTGVDINGPITFHLLDPSSLADALTNVESSFTEAPSLFSEIGTFLADGDYADAGLYTVAVSEGLTVGPVEELLIGAANGL